MIPAYEGKEPYIFVSYAHKDSAVVFRLVEQLNERGYRIWYDEGIEPGSEWPEYIANHLLGAEMVLSVLTPNAVNSVNCRREINFALSKNKPVLTIYMEDIELPVGLELQLSSQQSVLYYTYDSEERFLDKIETCQHLRPCKRAAGESGLTESGAAESGMAGSGAAESGAAAAHTGGSVSAKAADASAARGKAPVASGTGGSASRAGSSGSGDKLPPSRIALIAGACVAVLVVFFLVNPGKKKNTEPENAVTATTVQDNTGSETQDDANAAAQKDTQNDAVTQTDTGAETQADTGAETQNGADTTANTTDEPTADTTAATWDYTITRSDESTTYAFDRGPRIVMPASWGSQVTVIDEGDRVTFYHTASREAWAVDGMDNAGYLFRLCLDPTQDYKVYPSFMDLGKTSEGYFFLMFPTDFQAYANNERILEQYQTLYNELDYVKINSYME